MEELVAQLCPTLCDPMDCRLLCPLDSPGKNTGVGCHSLLQGIFPTQGSNQRLLIISCRQILYHLSRQGIFSHCFKPPWVPPSLLSSEHLSFHRLNSSHQKTPPHSLLLPPFPHPHTEFASSGILYERHRRFLQSGSPHVGRANHLLVGCFWGLSETNKWSAVPHAWEGLNSEGENKTDPSLEADGYFK